MLTLMVEIHRYGKDYGRNIGQRGGKSALSTSFWEPCRRFSFIFARVTGEAIQFFCFLKDTFGISSVLLLTKIAVATMVSPESDQI